jgi:uncharacterized membrane protein (UPF0127 family)
VRLVNTRTGEAIADLVEVAATRRARNRGLLGRQHLDPRAALMLKPCGAIHTAFMRFAIDVVFLDGDGRMLRVARRLKPWRLALDVRARAVIELAAGRVEDTDLRRGDRLHIEEAL